MEGAGRGPDLPPGLFAIAWKNFVLELGCPAVSKQRVPSKARQMVLLLQSNLETPSGAKQSRLALLDRQSVRVGGSKGVVS